MKLDSIGILFGNAWRRLRERFAVVVSIFLVPLVLIVISQLLVLQRQGAAFVLGSVIQIIYSIVSMIASIALISAFGKGTDFAASYQMGLKLFWSWIWIVILVILAVLGGFVMLIIPGIILSVQLAFVSYVFVLEGRRGMSALTLSREYVKGYGWAFVGRSILLLLCLLAAYIVLFLPATLLLGSVGAAIIYGLILLIFTPFSVAYQYEIYENLRRLKPDAAEAAAKAEKGFLKVSMVVGIVGAIAFFILICFGIAYGPGIAAKWHDEYPNNAAGYGNPMTIGTSTITTMPTSGPVGTKITIAGLSFFDATNTILMNGYVAARNVTSSSDGTLTFVMPASLAPDCDPHGICPAFVLAVTPGTSYDVLVRSGQAAVGAGTFTLTSK